MIFFDTELRIVIFSTIFIESREFYENTLKLKVLKEWDHGEGHLGVVYELGSCELEILSSSENTVSDDFYIYIKVKNIDSLWQDLQSKVTVTEKLELKPWGHTNFAIKDPNGYKLKFFTEAV